MRDAKKKPQTTRSVEFRPVKLSLVEAGVAGGKSLVAKIRQGRLRRPDAV